MVDRIMTVNAYTTFDMLEATVEGHGFEEDAMAVLNVTAPRKNPDHVSVQLELDNTDVSEVTPHAETVTISAAQARELADELEEYADRVDAATEG